MPTMPWLLIMLLMLWLLWYCLRPRRRDATPSMVLMLLLALSLLRTKIVAATHDQNEHIAEHCAVAMRFLNLSMYSKVHTFNCIPCSPKPVYSNTLHIVQLIALVVPNG